MTNNFFKIAGVGLEADAFNFFPFDDRDFLSTFDAYTLAEHRLAACTGEHKEARVAVHRKPKIHGAWKMVPEVGEGIDGAELGAFLAGDESEDLE